jgi:4-hydroxy-tetrahydrodipicolinate reductase
MKKINIGIYGSEGRMGKDIISRAQKFKEIEIAFLCEHSGHKSIGEKKENLVVSNDVKELISCSDVIIDFTNSKGTLLLLNAIRKSSYKPAIISGTTGFSRVEDKKFLESIKGLKVLRSFNMSLGINLMKSIVKTCSQNLVDLADIEIVEIHHNRKKDIPSGTAITLGESIKEGNQKSKKFTFREKNNDRVRIKNEIGFSSIRGGNVVGEHTVYFFMDGETIKLTHIASDRKVFSEGALRAAVWITKQKIGFYSTTDMLKI